MSKYETIVVRKAELVQLLAEIRESLKAMDEMAKHRPILFIAKSRLEDMLRMAEMDGEKTPVHRPSGHLPAVDPKDFDRR